MKKVITVFLLLLFFATPVLRADVIIRSSDGTMFHFKDDCCDDWKDLPKGWDCYENAECK